MGNGPTDTIRISPFAAECVRANQINDSPKYGTGDALAFSDARPLFVPNREPNKTAALQPALRTSRGCRKSPNAFSWPPRLGRKVRQESDLAAGSNM